MKWLISWWRRRQRAMDILVLWPSCQRICPTREEAQVMFFFHMEMDPAYSDLSHLEMCQLVDKLP